MRRERKRRWRLEGERRKRKLGEEGGGCRRERRKRGKKFVITALSLSLSLG